MVHKDDPGQRRRTAEQLLADAREGLDRVTPERALAALREGAVLIDIRSEVQRERDGAIPGSRFIPRNVLEWRCDPASPWREPTVADARGRLIVICNEGYQSSLAAATLQQIGFADATDVEGGFQAWRAAGLPVRQLTPELARVVVPAATGPATHALRARRSPGKALRARFAPSPTPSSA
jgi:rhodanese-related sulfurtransferase